MGCIFGKENDTWTNAPLEIVDETECKQQQLRTIQTSSVEALSNFQRHNHTFELMSQRFVVDLAIRQLHRSSLKLNKYDLIAIIYTLQPDILKSVHDCIYIEFVMTELDLIETICSLIYDPTSIANMYPRTNEYQGAKTQEETIECDYLI